MLPDKFDATPVAQSGERRADIGER